MEHHHGNEYNVAEYDQLPIRLAFTMRVSETNAIIIIIIISSSSSRLTAAAATNKFTKTYVVHIHTIYTLHHVAYKYDC